MKQDHCCETNTTGVTLIAIREYPLTGTLLGHLFLLKK